MLPTLLGSPKQVTKAQYSRDSLMKQWEQQDPTAYLQILPVLTRILSAKWWLDRNDNRKDSVVAVVDLLSPKAMTVIEPIPAPAAEAIAAPLVCLGKCDSRNGIFPHCSDPSCSSRKETYDYQDF